MQFEQEQMPVAAPRKSNVLGIVGFILAFCVSPIGLILSLVALARPPRGFAVAGTIVGLLGSAAWALVIFVFVVFGPAAVSIFENTSDYAQIARAIDAYKTNNAGALPPDLAALNLPADVLEDHEGNAYAYSMDPATGEWSITFIGWDGMPDTGDEVVLTSGMTESEVGQALGDAFGESKQP